MEDAQPRLGVSPEYMEVLERPGRMSPQRK
jgi:hypothetical protein